MARKTSVGLSPQQYGKEFENRIQGLLTKLQTKTRMRFHRLYDTSSTGIAGNALPEQDGDFIVVAHGKHWLIEVKSSFEHTSLGESRRSLTGLMKDHQAAGQRLACRAGGYGLVIFHQADTPYVEFWRGDHVGECYIKRGEHLDFGFQRRVPAIDADLTEALQLVLTNPKELFY